MNKPISPCMHGVLDYATVSATAAAPVLLDLPKPATRLLYGLAGTYLGLSALTDYPLSAARVVPFKAHGAAEVALGLALPALPWAFGFSNHRAARSVFLGLAALTFVVAPLTDWEA